MTGFLFGLQISCDIVEFCFLSGNWVIYLKNSQGLLINVIIVLSWEASIFHVRDHKLFVLLTILHLLSFPQ